MLKSSRNYRRLFIAAIIALTLAIAAMGVVGSSSPSSEWEDNLSKNTQWGRDLKAILDDAGVTDVASVETIVTLNEKEGDDHKKATGSEAKMDFDDYLTRNVTIKTESGKTLTTDYDPISGYLSLTDADLLVDYWRSADLSSSAFDLVSYETGEIKQAKNEEKAVEVEEHTRETIRKVETTTDLTKELEALGYSHDEAWDIQNTLSKLGVGNVSGVQVLSDNAPLNGLSANCVGHQVNFTTDNGKLFYVQITGWTDLEYDWYVNWRGKLSYGIEDKELSFDLYDTNLKEDGFIAYYKAAEDSVVPWDER